MMAGFSALMLLGIVSALIGREELRLTASKVGFRRHPGRALRTEIPVDEILEIRVGGDRGHREVFEALEIRSKGARIRFGSGLPGGVLERLRRVVSALATGGDPREAVGVTGGPAGQRIVTSRPRTGLQSGASTVVVAVAIFLTLIGALLWTNLRAPDAVTPEPVVRTHAAAGQDAPRAFRQRYATAERAVAAGDLETAEREFRRALAAAASLGPEDSRLASASRYLGWVLERQGRFREAAPLLERAIAIREPDDAALAAKEYLYIGTTLLRADLPARAVIYLRRSQTLSERVHGERSRETARRWTALAEAYEALGRSDEARACARRASEIMAILASTGPR